MTYGQYIKEHKVWAVIFAVLLCSVEIFLLTFSRSGWLMIYVGIAIVLGFFLGTYADFRRWKRYFDKLKQQLEALDKKYLLCELIDKGEYQEEKLLKEIFYEMESSMNERVSRYRRSSQEYKEYVEAWVHEIKIPIGAMKMILANHKDADYGLEDEVNRMEGYVEQALFYARSNDVEKDYLINRVSLQQVVQEVILKRRKVLRSMNARIELHDLETEVHSDSKWLAFMLGQIVDNSIKYGEKNRLVLEIYSEKCDNSVLLHMKDNGVGIKQSELSRVFDKGFTGSNGRAGAMTMGTETPGMVVNFPGMAAGTPAVATNSTGIGLYLCKKLCKRLEHNIKIDSKEGEGTTVTFVFPISNMITNNLTEV